MAPSSLKSEQPRGKNHLPRGSDFCHVWVEQLKLMLLLRKVILCDEPEPFHVDWTDEPPAGENWSLLRFGPSRLALLGVRLIVLWSLDLTLINLAKL